MRGVNRLALAVCALGIAIACEAQAQAPEVSPPKPYVQRDVCPFECCTYGTWIPRRPLRVFALERDTTHVAFTLARGDSFTAVTGNVHVLRLGEARVLKAFRLLGTDRATGSERSIPLARGDRIVIVDYYSEGGVQIWCRDQMLDVDDEDWLAPSYGGGASTDTRARLVHALVSEWWVHVHARDGRDGWLRMSEDPDEPLEVDGADLCG